MKDMTSGSPLKLILGFAIPLFIGSILQQAYLLINGIIIGKYLGTGPLAAAGVAGPIMYFVSSIVLGFVIGFSILVSQYKGADNEGAIKSSIVSLLTLLFLSGVLVTFIGLMSIDVVLTLLNTPQEVKSLCAPYLSYLYFGIIFSFLSMGIGGVLRGLGDAKTPLTALLIGCTVNLILDLIFIVKLKMGIEGAGLSTVISQVIGFLIISISAFKNNPLFKGALNFKLYDNALLLNGLKMGLSPAMQHIMLSGGILILVYVIASFGTVTLAAASVVGRIEGFMIMFFAEFGSALTTFVGQNYGKNDFARLKNAFTSSIIFVVIVSVVMSVAIIVFAREVVGLFTFEETVIKVSLEYMDILMPFFFTLALTNVWHGYLNGLGKVNVALICTLVAFGLTRVPLTVLLGNVFGMNGIWWAGSIGWVVGFGYTWIRFRNINRTTDTNETETLREASA